MSEAVGDAGFELLDLVREEEDPEAAATDCKVSTYYACLLCSQRELLRAYTL